ncbi:Oligopeptide transport ATP-binding protein OppD [compost metagenome]
MGLLQSIPGFEGERGGELFTIRGNIPPIGQLPSGCRFHPRCPHAMDVCRSQEPPNFMISGDHRSACWLFQNKPVQTDYSDEVRTHG